MTKILTLAAGLGLLLASATAYALSCAEPVSVSALTPVNGAPSGLCLRYTNPAVTVMPCNDTIVFDDQVYRR